MSKPFWPGGSGFPWWQMVTGARGRFFEAGEIRLALLSLLSEGPKHGYQLMKEMSDRSGGFYKASAGSVYPTLQQLEDEGMVTAEMISGRRTYTLTDAGRAELASAPDAVNRIWNRAEQYEGWSQWMGPEAAVVYAPLITLFKTGLQAASRLGGKPEGAERIRAILERARKELEEL
jgi:DNA-binding PadR family transcriptional regulator